jgi:hypothetical protein
MATIENPTIKAFADTMHINNIEFPALPLRADDNTVNRYCLENSMTMSSYTQDSARISNDGARLYNYWDTVTSEWKNAWGYSPIVTEITYT